jgi:hypothetical protein
MVVALVVLRYVLRALWWLLRALAAVAWRVTLLALAALLFVACMAFPWLRRLAWQFALMAVGLSLTRRGGPLAAVGVYSAGVPRSPDERPDSRRTSERLGTGNAPVAKLRPVSAQSVATSAAEAQRYGVHGVGGAGMLTMLVGASGMGKTEAKFGMLRAQYDGRDFCGLATTRPKRVLFLTEMERGLMREYLRRWGFLVEPQGAIDRVRLALWTPRSSPGAFLDVEYASKVFDPDAQGLTTDWPAVLHRLRRDATRRYGEVVVDTYAEWMGSDSNDHASEMLGLCRQLTKDGQAVTVTHHTPLSDPTRQKGGMGVLRALDAGWALYGVGEGGKKRSLKDPERMLACFKLRRQEDAPDAPLRLELVPGDPAAGVLPRYQLVDRVTPVTPGATAAVTLPPAAPILTDRQRAVLAALKRTPDRTATTPELAAAAGLDGDRTGQILNALVDKRLVAPAGTGAPNANGSKPPRRWKATPLAIAVAEEPAAATDPEPVPVVDPADRLLREALDG